MKIRDIEINKIEYNYFILSKTELKALIRAIELEKKKKLSEPEKLQKEAYKKMLEAAPIREQRIFKNIDTIRANAKDGKRSEWMKSMFLVKAVNKALEKDFENITTYRTLNFIRSFYEIERKQFNKNNKRVTKYKLGRKLKTLTFEKLYKYLFLIDRSKY